MKEQRWRIIFVALVVVFIAASVWTQVRKTAGSPFDPRPSTYNPSPPGLMAFYLYLEESGYNVRRWLRPLDEIEDDENVPAILVLSTPSTRPMPERDTEALRSWIETGGVLLYLVDFDLSPGKKKETLHDALDLPVERHAPTYFLISAAPVGSASATLPYPLLEGLGGISVQDSADLLPAAGNSITLFSDSEGPALLWRPVGAGQMFVARSGASMSNQAILSEDNLRFWLRVLHGVPGAGPVAFVEYYHGYSAHASQSAWTRLDVRIAAAQAVLVAIMLLFALGKRFGGRVRILDQSRRSTLEYVDSMARLFRRAGAEEHVRAETLRRFFLAATHALGLPPDAPVPELSHRLAELTGRSPTDIDALLSRHDSLETVAWAGSLCRLEAEVRERTSHYKA